MCRFSFALQHINTPYKCTIFLNSAGVGRTGTFIIIDAMLQMMQQQHEIDIYDYFVKIRNNRVQLVQTVVSYSMLFCSVDVSLSVSLFVFLMVTFFS